MKQITVETTNIMSSNMILGCKVIVLIALLTPKTNNMLNMFNPITFPIIIPVSPFFNAVKEVTTSGNYVPIATMVKPTNV